MGRATKWAALKKRSTMVRMTVLPDDETSDEVQGDVRPGASRDWQRLQEASGRQVRCLVPGTNGAGRHILLDILKQRRPPKLASEQSDGAVLTRVAG